jgi:lysophospholipase L1-like esterase
MPLRLAVLGDSIGYGVGASRPQDTLAPRLAAELSSMGLPTDTMVLAVPGARSSDLAAQVDRATAWQPDVVVIVIGANDLTRLVPAAEAAAQLERAVRALRSSGAEVVVAPAPDLSVVAHVPAVMRELVQAASRQLREAQAHATIAAGGRVADPDASTTVAFGRDPLLFCQDGLHPSSAGYALIAAALAPAVRAAAADVAFRQR